MKPNFTPIEVPKISAFGHFSTRTYVNMRFATFYHSGVGLSVNFLIFFSAWVISCLKMHFRLKHFVIYSMGIKTALKFETCLVSSFFVSLNFIKIACFLLHHLWTPILSQLIHPICKQGEALNLFPAFEVLRFFLFNKLWWAESQQFLHSDIWVKKRMHARRLAQLAGRPHKLTWPRIWSSKRVCWDSHDIHDKNAVNRVSWGKQGQFLASNIRSTSHISSFED